MRAILGCTLAALVVCFSVSAEDKKDEKIDAKKLVGKWSLKGLDKGDSVVLEFQKDAKMVLVGSVGGKEERVEWSYKIDGNKLSLTTKIDGKEETKTLTLSKLTDAELVGTTETGKERSFVRIKDK